MTTEGARPERSSEPAIALDVIVVGAGPVGLSCAIELGMRGHRVLVIEREVARGLQPRAKTLNMRSLTYFRRWDVAARVRAASPVPEDVRPDVIFQTRLFGHHIATVPNIYFRGGTHADDPRFCEPSEWVPQYIVERVLREKLETLPNVRMQLGTEFTSLSQTADGVEIVVAAAGGTTDRFRASYAIGADGARSAVRGEIGATMTGRHAFAANYNVVLRIPELDRSPPVPRGQMHWMLNTDSPAVIGPIGDRWYIAKQLPPGVSSMSETEIAQCVTAAVGREVEFEILTVDPWYAHQLIADSYRRGRVFLAGDACHLHPPFGGYGMNMGIGDAVDLAWKLSAVLAGWGGAGLLGSYEIERRKVHEWTIEEAIENYRLLTAELVQPGLDEDTPEGLRLREQVAAEIVQHKTREFHTIGLVLGYHYGGSPVIACNDDLPPPRTMEYIPAVRCGALAPHVWIDLGVSIYDRFGLGLTLVDTVGDDEPVAVFERAAADLTIPLTIFRSTAAEVADVYERQLTLIRPDAHVCWRGAQVDHADACRILRTVTGRDRLQEPAA